MGYTLKLVETYEDKADNTLDLISGAEGIRLNEGGLYLPPPSSIWTETGESYRNDGSSLGAQKYENREMTIDLFVAGTDKSNLILKLQKLQEFIRKASYHQKSKTGNYQNYAGDGIAHRIELRYALSDLPETSFGRGITRFEIINGNVEIPSNLHSYNLVSDRIDSIKLNLTLKPFSYGKIGFIGKGYATSWDFDNILQEENAITFHPSYLCDIKYPTFIDTEEGTVSLWFRAIDPSTWAHDRSFFCTNLGGSAHNCYYQYSNQRFVWEDGNGHAVYFNKAFVADQLLHIVLRWHLDPDRITISIDGTHAVNEAYTEPNPISHCHIGGNNSHLYACNGHIYDFRAWESELSDDQVAQVYGEGIGRTLLPMSDKDVVYNHHDSAHTNYFNILGVAGDIPAGALIALNNTSGADKHIKSIRISQRTWGNVENFRHIWEGEDKSGEYGGTWTEAGDGTCSNAKLIHITTASPTTVYGCYWSKTDNLLDNEGVYQVFARVLITSASTDFRVRFGTDGYFDNEWVTSDYFAKWHLVDLGEITFPTRDLSFGSERYYLALYFDCQSTTSQIIYLDYLAIFPKKPVYGEWEAQSTLYRLLNGRSIAFETFDYQQMWQMIYRSGSHNYAWDISGASAMGDIYLEPRIPNHFRVIADRDPTDTHKNYITDQFTLQYPDLMVLYRYLTME